VLLAVKVALPQGVLEGEGDAEVVESSSSQELNVNDKQSNGNSNFLIVVYII
tara:strand:- start:500 stop:655 length:156 start_codon:yes stop_codon:yes gene_type:complete